MPLFDRTEKLGRVGVSCTTLPAESVWPSVAMCVQTRLRIRLRWSCRGDLSVYKIILCRVSGRNRYLGGSEGEARDGRYAEPNKHFLSDDKPCSTNSATNDDEGSGAWGFVALVLPVLVPLIATHPFGVPYIPIFIITRIPPRA